MLSILQKDSLTATLLTAPKIYKLEISKFMAKAFKNDSPALRNNHPLNFRPYP